MSELARRTPRAVLEALGVWAGVSALYLATLSGNHSETEDTLTFAARIRDDPHSDAPS